ncbi:MAG: dienelactone hydrolase family protein [Pyrinomonadaceae bacterium]|nr:dienelactone hydrolase family protein [Pyrinomonadaceae bacterium]
MQPGINSERTEERTLSAQIKIYYDVYVPPEDEGRAARPLLVALHGYGASKRQMMREARAIAPDDFVIASIQGFHQHIRDPKEEGGPLRFGFGWVTNFHPEEAIALHHKAVNHVLDTLIEEGICDGERVFLLGFSQTCALNYRYAFTHAKRLRGTVGICGGLPGDWETSELYHETSASVLYLHGTRDEFYTPERVRDYGERLRMRARDVEVKSYDAAHEIVPAMREDVREWLQSRASRV